MMRKVWCAFTGLIDVRVTRCRGSHGTKRWLTCGLSGIAVGLLVAGVARAQSGGVRILEWISVSSNGTPGDSASYDPSVNADGRYVAFRSVASNLVPGGRRLGHSIYVRDRVAGVTELVSVPLSDQPGRRYSDSPAISADGRFVAFRSETDQLVPGYTSAHLDTFVRDRATVSPQ